MNIIPTVVYIRQYEELQAKSYTCACKIRFMFVSNHIRSLDHANPDFKLNRIMKNFNWSTKRL